MRIMERLDRISAGQRMEIRKNCPEGYERQTG